MHRKPAAGGFVRGVFQEQLGRESWGKNRRRLSTARRRVVAWPIVPNFCAGSFATLTEVIGLFPRKFHTHKCLLNILGICRPAEAAQIDGFYTGSLA